MPASTKTLRFWLATIALVIAAGIFILSLTGVITSQYTTIAGIIAIALLVGSFITFRTGNPK